MQADSGRRRWWVISGVTAGVTAVGLAVLLWFLIDEGRVRSDQWASIFGLILAYLIAMASVLMWLLRRAGKPNQSEPAGLGSVQVTAGRDAYTAGEMTFHRPAPDATNETKAPQ